MNGSGVLLSIITVNLNNDIGLKKTIESVLMQEGMPFEFIVIDGGSVDKSVYYIRESEKKIQYWRSEKDRGIYAAMNKGLKKADGDYVLFLNSGDSLSTPNILKEIHPLLEESPDILSCGLMVENEKGDYDQRFPLPSYTYQNIFLKSLPHQSTLIKRSLFQTWGTYDEGFRIAADWEFWLRIAANPIQYKTSTLILSNMEKEGLGAHMNDDHFKERLRIFNRYRKRLRFNLQGLRLLIRNRNLALWYTKNAMGL
jgi:glycosyltransferase involved in cell wall biosynthesis